MKGLIRQFVKFGTRLVVKGASRNRIGRYFIEQVLNAAVSIVSSVRHQGVDLTFYVPNRVNYFRVDTFSTKEPETLEWIDSIPRGSVVWDVGANVGLYTCYAAKARGCRVVAFEPSVFNLDLLARNVFLNGLTDQVTIVPLPLSDALTTSTLNMSSTEWGAALSSFGQTYGQDGLPLAKIFEFKTIGITMAGAVNLLKIAQPDYVKMDVDGIEHLILKGGGKILQNTKGMLIEINEEFEKQRMDSACYLNKAGLVLKEKRHSDMFENSVYKNSYNQIWNRPPQ